MKKRKPLDAKEKVLDFFINQTNDNLIIQMNEGDTNSNEKTTKQHKKLKRTNKRYLANHKNKEDNMFDALFFNDGDDFFAHNMT
jgi:hypothetical protein